MMILQQTRGALSSGGFDPIAARYLRTIESAGATTTQTQRNAISSFMRAGKSGGWFSKIGRLYLPIWGVDAQNAVDLITSGSGTFSGSITRAAGYVQGDGTTGIFDLGVTPGAVGMTTSSGYIFALVTQASTLGFRGLIGRSQSSSSVATFLSNNSSQLVRYNSGAASINGTSAGTGIISFSREGGNRSIYRRITSGRSVLFNAAGADSGSIPTGGNLAALALNANGADGFTGNDFNNARFGAFGVGLGLNNTDEASFTAALKTLWETCTGLTLP